jgi:hypothetical protein
MFDDITNNMFYNLSKENLSTNKRYNMLTAACILDLIKLLFIFILINRTIKFWK